MVRIKAQFVTMAAVAAGLIALQGCERKMPNAVTTAPVPRPTQVTQEKTMDTNADGKVVRTEEEWKKLLSPEEYHILREKGTERPFTGKYTTYKEDGVYKCGACGAVLFASDSKFDSHCGWPSFSSPSDANAVTESLDTSHGMVRTEITCSKCGSHLGHVFNDGPGPNGLRYCINSVALDFEKKSDKDE